MEGAVESYHKGKTWSRDATRNKSHAALRAFVEFTGVKCVNEVIKLHAYRFASGLSDRGFANGTFKDMLRNSGVSKEINDFITGHSQGDSASNYGAGPSISVRYDAIKDLDLSFMANQRFLVCQ